MDLAAILADITTILNVGKLAVQVGADAAPYLETAWQLASGTRTMTDAERAALSSQEAQMRATIDAQIAQDDASA